MIQPLPASYLSELGRFAAKGQVQPASTLGPMSDDRVFQALQGMRAEVAAVNSGIAGLTTMVVSVQENLVSLTADVATLQADVREIRRDVSDLRSAMTEHLNWHLGQAS